MEFKRPEGSIYPQIYKTFVVKDEEFYITDLTADHSEQALDLITQYVIPEENFCKAIQIHTKPNAMKIMMESYRDLFKKQMSLVCIKKETGELVGLNILGVKTKGEESKAVDDPDMRTLRESSAFTAELFDVFDHFQVDHYLHAFGLGVNSKHRGKGIAVELLKARVTLLKALGLNVTATIFSTLSSQKAAVKAGYEETFAISYKDVQQKFPHFDFSKATGTHCKTFVMKVV